MPGICGIVRNDQSQLSPKNMIPFNKSHNAVYNDDSVRISAVLYDAIRQPSESSDESLIWVWGNIYTHSSECKKYVSKSKCFTEKCCNKLRHSPDGVIQRESKHFRVHQTQTLLTASWEADGPKSSTLEMVNTLRVTKAKKVC